MTELAIDLPGDLDADFYPDGTALLVVHTHAGRTTVHRYDLASGELTDLPVAVGVVSGASARAGRLALVSLVQRRSPRAIAGTAPGRHR